MKDDLDTLLVMVEILTEQHYRTKRKDGDAQNTNTSTQHMKVGTVSGMITFPMNRVSNK